MASPCLFASDLHGRGERYRKLFAAVMRENPAAVFLGGDLLPGAAAAWRPDASGAADEQTGDFVDDFIVAGLRRLRERMRARYPRVFLILGNDDPRTAEPVFTAAAAEGLCEYVHMAQAVFGDYTVYGYACVPPTPFLLKDWERYDVSRYVDPGAVAPEEGVRTIEAAVADVVYGTIAEDLARLTVAEPLTRAIVLFHAPPYRTKLDRAALDGRMIDHAPMDVHVGSIAIRRLIEQQQPLLTLHGHVHESPRLTGAWQERLGRTYCYSAAHDGPELALVRFDPGDPPAATRTLL